MLGNYVEKGGRADLFHVKQIEARRIASMFHVKHFGMHAKGTEYYIYEGSCL